MSDDWSVHRVNSRECSYDGAGLVMLGVIFILLLVGASSVWGEEARDEDFSEQILLETFSPPEPISRGSVKYPRKSQVRGKEGWVTMSYMVDTVGTPYDVTVVHSSGDAAFEKAAVRATKNHKYTPAKLGDVAIDAGAMSKITFRLSGDTGATRSFRKLQKQLMEQIAQDNKEQASLILNELSELNRNLYEEAYFNLATYTYYLKWGSVKQRYAALRAAAFVDASKEFLPDKALTTAMYGKLLLELQLNYMGRALGTGTRLLKRKLSDEMRNQVTGLVQRVEALKQSDESFGIDGVIGKGNRFNHLLLRSEFRFENIEGDIAELRLHCDKGYVGFIFKDDIQYKVRDGLSNCGLTVIGTPDTSFQLVEF